MARGVDDRATGGPDGAFARDRDAVGDRGTTAARRNADDLAHILAAVASESAEADVDVTVGDGERRTLLVGPRIVASQVQSTRPQHGARGGIQGEQDVLEAGHFRDGKQRARRRVVRGRARDPQRIDVSARQRRKRHRAAQVGVPAHRAVRRIERVDAIALGCGDHVPRHDQRLRVDGPVKGRRPVRGQGTAERREGGVVAGSTRVEVIHRPVRRGNLRCGEGRGRSGRGRSGRGRSGRGRSGQGRGRPGRGRIRQAQRRRGCDHGCQQPVSDSTARSRRSIHGAPSFRRPCRAFGTWPPICLGRPFRSPTIARSPQCHPSRIGLSQCGERRGRRTVGLTGPAAWPECWTAAPPD